MPKADRGPMSDVGCRPCTVGLSAPASQDSNLEPRVLETRALPLELETDYGVVVDCRSDQRREEWEGVVER